MPTSKGPDEKHDLCPVCKNHPDKRQFTVNVGPNNKITKKCAKCLGTGKVPKGKG